MPNVLLVTGFQPENVSRVCRALLSLDPRNPSLCAAQADAGRAAVQELSRLILSLFGQRPDSVVPLDLSTVPSALYEALIERARSVTAGVPAGTWLVVGLSECGAALPFWMEALDPAAWIQLPPMGEGPEESLPRPPGETPSVAPLSSYPGSATAAPRTRFDFRLSPDGEAPGWKAEIREFFDRLARSDGASARQLFSTENAETFMNSLSSAHAANGAHGATGGGTTGDALRAIGKGRELLRPDSASAVTASATFSWGNAPVVMAESGKYRELLEALAIDLEEREARLEFLRNDIQRQTEMLSRRRDFSRQKQREYQLTSQLQIESGWRRRLQRNSLFRLLARPLGLGQFLEDPQILAAADPENRMLPAVSRDSKSRDSDKLQAGLESLREKMWGRADTWPLDPEDIAFAPSPREVEVWLKLEQALEMRPLISVLSPVHRIKQEYLRAMIQSVFDQVYAHWELCLCVDDSVSAEAKEVIASFERICPERVKVVGVEGVPGIAASTNRAAEMASGEFICLLDHDDRLTPDALLLIAQYAGKFRDADMIYSDEDRVRPDGKLGFQFIKPDYSPELLLSFNYVCHLLTLRRTFFEALGRLREGFDGSQDYDLILRAGAKARRVVHIPEILYHWRMHQDSIAQNLASKLDMCRDSSLQALKDFAGAQHISSFISEESDPTTYRVRFAVVPQEKVSVIIPTSNNLLALRTCVRSIKRRTQHPNYEILVVSNNTVLPQMLDYMDREVSRGTFRLIRKDVPFNFSTLINFGAANSDSPYLLFLNDDTEVISANWMTALLEHAQRPGIGAVGARLFYPSGTVQHAGVYLNPDYIPGHAFQHLAGNDPGYFYMNSVVRNCIAVTAACMMVKRAMFDEAGGFDESLAVTFNDVDFCLKLFNAGYRNVVTPYAELTHFESATRGRDCEEEKHHRLTVELEKLRSRWMPLIPRDPYFIPEMETSFGARLTSDTLSQFSNQPFPSRDEPQLK